MLFGNRFYSTFEGVKTTPSRLCFSINMGDHDFMPRPFAPGSCATPERGHPALPETLSAGLFLRCDEIILLSRFCANA